MIPIIVGIVSTTCNGELTMRVKSRMSCPVKKNGVWTTVIKEFEVALWNTISD